MKQFEHIAQLGESSELMVWAERDGSVIWALSETGKLYKVNDHDLSGALITPDEPAAHPLEPPHIYAGEPLLCVYCRRPEFDIDLPKECPEHPLRPKDPSPAPDPLMTLRIAFPHFFDNSGKCKNCHLLQGESRLSNECPEHPDRPYNKARQQVEAKGGLNWGLDAEGKIRPLTVIEQLDQAFLDNKDKANRRTVDFREQKHHAPKA